MLRRVAWLRRLRIGLFIAGIGTLLWLPLSLSFDVFAQWPRASGGGLEIVVGGGGLYFSMATGSGVRYSYPHFHAGVEPAYYDTDELLKRAAPRFRYESTILFRKLTVSTPLWLLAVICLAWPVTSLIIARRRCRGRGFEVQTEVSAQNTEVSPASEAPKVRSSEAQGASPG